MMSGFARITISLCVIVTELTGSKFPLLLQFDTDRYTVLIANYGFCHLCSI